MSLDILQQERHRSGNHDLAVTPYILNKTLILIENDLLKISGKKLSDFNMESPLQTDDNDNNFLRDRAYIAETSYDYDILSNYIQENEPKLTNDQQVVYNTILQSVLQDNGELFFFDAPGGSGKTFMLNLLLAKLRVERIISLAVASSGIAATLLQNGKTAHSAFKLPLDLQTNERPVCSVKKQSSLGKLLRETRFIVWDESTMANKGGPEALDRTLRDFKNNDRPMGGVVILFAGDFRQILPVVPKGTKSDEINACLKSSYLWSYITSLRLTTNMRVHLGGDNNAELFSQHLLKISNGTFQNDKDSIIQINSTFAISVLDQNNLINKVYPEISHLSNKSNEWLRERAILAPKNDIVNIINEKVLSMFEADKKTIFP
ncbi:ATP-dependent DNA helicase pif1-like [Metopolophium dirhodum]|uniref:ATP-dependent DNA helicase pif1-like n=1 Tax=Metopolophium dirhodum TaxID=44670 RepID=UPI0029905383|nr:ATP-dependent DNA helicase pif1-like [Metopolophium dirhodum]